MKHILIFVILSAVLISFGCFSDRYLQTQFGRLDRQLSQVEDAVREETPAADAYARLRRSWHARKHTLEMLTDHKEIRAIDEHIDALAPLLSDPEQRTPALQVISELRVHIRAVPHHMQPRPENIL